MGHRLGMWVTGYELSTRRGAEYMYSEKYSLAWDCHSVKSSIKSQVLDLKTLPIFSPLKISVNKGG